MDYSVRIRNIVSAANCFDHCSNKTDCAASTWAGINNNCFLYKKDQLKKRRKVSEDYQAISIKRKCLKQPRSPTTRKEFVPKCKRMRQHEVYIGGESTGGKNNRLTSSPAESNKTMLMVLDTSAKGYFCIHTNLLQHLNVCEKHLYV